MAVEARSHLIPQSLSSRDFAANTPPTVCGTTAATSAAANPRYGLPSKSESGVTYVADNNTRKRPRARDDDTIHDYRGSSLLGEDLALQIHQQQLHIDRFIAQHAERVRMEIEERRRRYSRQMAQALAQHIKKKLKSKEDEVVRIGKLNLALQERIKSLTVENRMWRDVAQTNEATANALRRNLEQALQRAAEDDDDARSSCGSNYEARDRRMCRRCEREESCVLLLPCRHLCLCTVCGSSTHACPICHSIKTASVRVNC